jgi:phage gpG-like protein
MARRAGAITTKQAAAALMRFDSRLDALVTTGMNNGLNYALKVATTKYMVGGRSRDPFIDPPNPAPGPLKIRSGALRRGAKVARAKKSGNVYVGGLKNDVPYAAIHEFGGQTRAHFIEAREADTLAFIGRDGNMVFREVVFHPGSKIPARPSFTPALEESQEKIDQEITLSMIRGVEDALSGMAA